MHSQSSFDSIYYKSFVIVTPFSGICSLVLMVLIIIVQQKETNQMRRNHLANIFWMSFSDFGFSIRNAVGYIGGLSNKMFFFCWLSAFGSVFFVIAMQSWYFIIGLQIYVPIKYITLPRWMDNRYFYHIYAWSISFFSAISLFHAYGHGPITNRCWIIGPRYYKIFLFIPSTIYLWFAIYLLLLMHFTMRSSFLLKEKKIIMQRTTVFVGVFVITWFPNWIRLILEIFFNVNADWIYYTASIVGASSGIFNFIVWIIFSPKIRNTCVSFQNIYSQQRNSLDISNEQKIDTSLLIESEKDYTSDFTGTYFISDTDSSIIKQNSFESTLVSVNYHSLNG